MTEGGKTQHQLSTHSLLKTQKLCKMWVLGREALWNEARSEESASASYHDVSGVLGPDGSRLHQRKADLQKQEQRTCAFVSAAPW